MGIISWIILGLIAGYIGSKIVDKHGQGFWLNMALGIVGALDWWISVQFVWGGRRQRFEYLQHDRGDHRFGGGAAGL